ncbi:MAG: hypothetical protein IT379_15160 [Deltaproteobacteria bacterium]|nr:hypothetical protein [Deltaproteobacteria bacterium]
MDHDDMKSTVPGIGSNCTAKVRYRPESTIDLDVVSTPDGDRLVPVFTRGSVSRPEMRAAARLPRKVASGDEPTVVVSPDIDAVGMTRTIPNWRFRKEGDETRLAVRRLRGTLRERAVARWVLALAAGGAVMCALTAMAAATTSGIVRDGASQRAAAASAERGRSATPPSVAPVVVEPVSPSVEPVALRAPQTREQSPSEVVAAADLSVRAEVTAPDAASAAPPSNGRAHRRAPRSARKPEGAMRTVREIGMSTSRGDAARQDGTTAGAYDQRADF